MVMQTNAAKTPAAKRHWIALIWLGVGLIDATQTVFPMRAQGMHHAWVRLFATQVVNWLPWALATPLIVNLTRRFPLLRAASPRAYGIHLGAIAAIDVAVAAWTSWLEVVFDPWLTQGVKETFIGLWLPKCAYELLPSLVLYGFIVAIVYVIDSTQRIATQQAEAAQLSEQLSKAQFNVLRQQMNPHFMFNALNAISGLVREHRNDAAVTTIVGLGDLLRRALQDANRPRVPLSEEVDYLKRYLEIQQIRFGERLSTMINIPDELLSIEVPNLILQPIVENAIKHGVEKSTRSAQISVSGSRAAGRLELRVCNNGPGLPETWNRSDTGIGLANLRARLQILYATHFDLQLRNQDTGGVEVLVSLPAS